MTRSIIAALALACTPCAPAGLTSAPAPLAATTIDFAWSMRNSEAAHYEALVRYIKTFGLAPAFRGLSTSPDACRAFAKRYNGSDYEKGGYHRKLAAAIRLEA